MTDRPAPHDELDALLEALVEERLSDDDAARLEALVRDDRAARRRYVRFIHLHATLSRQHRSVQLLPRDVADVEPIDHTTAETYDFQTQRALGGRPRKNVLHYAAAAAILFAAALGGFWWQSSRPGNDTPSEWADAQDASVTLIDTGRAEWDAASPAHGVGIGEVQANGPLVLNSGSAEVLLDSGVVVTLIGATAFEVTGANRAELTYGAVVAHVPPGAHGFEIVTPRMSVVDLGTRFGVYADRMGLSEAHVFEGHIEVRDRTTDDATPRSLTAGQAVRREPASRQLIDIAVSREHFEPAPDNAPEVAGQWRSLAPGVEGRGQVDWLAKAPASMRPHDTEGKRAMLMRERSGVTLSEPLDVDIDRPGDHVNTRRIVTAFRPTAAVDSYLLHFDPIGETQGNANQKRATLMVRFDRPILALITAEKTLEHSDAILGLAGVKYNSVTERKRLMEDGDFIRLSDDRRTLTVCMTTGVSIDQMRIIVEAAR